MNYNKASTSGGGVYVGSGTFVIYGNNSNWKNTLNGASYNSATYGGAIYCDGGEVELDEMAYISNNTATYGAGVYITQVKFGMIVLLLMLTMHHNLVVVFIYIVVNLD